MKNMIMILVLLALAACTPQSEPPPSADEGQTPQTSQPTPTVESQTPEGGVNLANTNWSLVSFGEPGAETPVIEGSSITLEFDAQGRAGGSGGCNSYGAQYEIQGNTISFGEITSTLIACEREGIDQQEQNFYRALESTSKFELAGDRLTIWYNGEQGVLNWLKSN